MDQKILLYKVNSDELFNIGIVNSNELENHIEVICNLLDELHISKQFEIFNVSVDYEKPFQLIEIFNLMGPGNIELIGVKNFKNKADALNEKTSLEYEISKYPGTDVSSFLLFNLKLSNIMI